MQREVQQVERRVRDRVGEQLFLAESTSGGATDMDMHVEITSKAVCCRGEARVFREMRRIGGITYQNNTRLGAAIRHAASRLARQEARTRLLIVLSDGRPYDHDYGDARYARDDTREALREAKIQGITPFCITIDRESEAELKDLYGDVGYTIIDDVLNLPERMPGIYRRLTT